MLLVRSISPAVRMLLSYSIPAVVRKLLSYSIPAVVHILLAHSISQERNMRQVPVMQDNRMSVVLWLQD